MKKISAQAAGFSLIELLVVIAVMAMVMAVGLPNYLSARQRARDVRMKESMTQFKQALRMYFNDHQRYPANGSPAGMRIGGAAAGCGVSSNAACGAVSGCHFMSGADDCTGTVYMKQFPDWGTNGFSSLRYYTSADGQAFILRYPLENQGDADIAASQTRCAGSMSATGQTLVATNYYVCED